MNESCDIVCRKKKPELLPALILVKLVVKLHLDLVYLLFPGLQPVFAPPAEL
jgi:hypothetical protein